MKGLLYIMTKFVAVPIEDIPENRLVALTRKDAEGKDVTDTDKVFIRLAKEGELAEFASSKNIVSDESVVVNIGESHIWIAEAGEDIDAGVPIISGDKGVVISNLSKDGSPHPRTLGYSIHSAKQGEEITFVKDYRVAGDSISGGGADNSEEIKAIQDKQDKQTKELEDLS